MRLELRLERGELFLGHGLDVGVGLGQHGFGVGDAVGDLAVLAILFDDRLHVAVFLGDGLELLLVVDEGGVGHVAGERVVTGFHLGEAVEHLGAPLERGIRD